MSPIDEFDQSEEQGAADNAGTPSPDASAVEAQPAESAHERPFGVGGMPLSLYRFNWGAFFLPFFWGTAYGVWPILMAWGLGFVTPVLLGVLSGPSATELPVFIALAVASEIAAGIVRLWAGVSANTLLWRREQTRLELLPDAAPRFSIERFAIRQRSWAVGGAVALVAISTIGTVGLILVPSLESAWREYGLAIAGPLMTIVWLAVEVGLGLWLDVRMKTDPPPTEAPSQAL